MKRQLENDLMQTLAKYMDKELLQSVRLEITMVLNDYKIEQEERSIVVYEQNETEMAIKRFLAAKIAKGCTPRTVKYYKTEVTKIMRVIGKPYDQVTADDIRYYLAKRVQMDRVSKVTANSERRALSSFYQWLQKEEILLKNPMNKIDSLKEAKKKKKAFEQIEVERIRDACRTNREKAMVEVLLSTWARVSEVVQIKIDEIENERVVVHGKGEKDRYVYMTPKAQLMVSKYLEERTDTNPYLFPRAKNAGNVKAMTKGKRKNEMAEWYKKSANVDDEKHMDAGSLEHVIRGIGKRASVKNTHPHRFRRTGATMALRTGMPLLKVSKLLGHEQISTTQIYLDISDEELMQAHGLYVK